MRKSDATTPHPLKRGNSFGFRTILAKANAAKLDLSKPLPIEWRYTSAGKHFQNIGIYSKDASPSPADSWSHFFYNPWFCITLELFVGIRALAIMLYPGEFTLAEERAIFYLGDISVIINLRYHFCMLLITFVYTILLFQFIHYRQSKKSYTVSWCDTRPFNLLNGRASPSQIGIRSLPLLVRFNEHARFLFRSSSTIRSTLFVVVLIAYSSVLFYRFFQPNFQTTIGFVTTIFHSFAYMFFSDFFYAFTLYHVLYFYLICEYLRIRMKQPIQDLDQFRYQGKKIKNIQKYRSMRRLMVELHWILNEAKLCNKRFWKNIIMTVFLCFAVNVSIFGIVAFFGNLELLVRDTCFGVVLVELTIFGTILYSASNVNNLSGEIYFKLNCFYVRTMFNDAQDERAKRQVKIQDLTTNYMLNMHRFKIQNLMSSFTLDKFGFTCGPMFVVNYWISLEVIMVMLSFFLKLIQLGNYI